MADETDEPADGEAGATRYAISLRELEQFANLQRYRAAFFATGSACLAFALSIWMGAELDLGEWEHNLPDGLWGMRNHAVPILSGVAAAFYALGALFGFRARRLADTVRTRPV